MGTDHDTSASTVQGIRRWWFTMGYQRYPEDEQQTIAADGCGNDGYRVRLWKLELSRVAQETGLRIRVCYFPPGTSKWNRIEHRLFSLITMNWRGRPLISDRVIVQLIASTKTCSGLTVRSEIDFNSHSRGAAVSDADFADIKPDLDAFDGKWNDSIHPL